jgi:hypothetical protein
MLRKNIASWKQGFLDFQMLNTRQNSPEASNLLVELITLPRFLQFALSLDATFVSEYLLHTWISYHAWLVIPPLKHMAGSLPIDNFSAVCHGNLHMGLFSTTSLHWYEC